MNNLYAGLLSAGAVLPAPGFAAGGMVGRKIDYTSSDTQSQPQIAKALAQQAVDQDAYVVPMDVSFDQNGDLDRESFMTRVENGKQVVFAVLPPLAAK